MCGIIGYVASERRAFFERGLGLIAHRGPDGEGIADGVIGQRHFWLGHRRLSIIDIVGGSQPFNKRELLITFNGEIYNYLELAEILRRDHGVAFVTRSDTEVLLEAFATWGPSCVQRLRGMFAFAILDTRSGELFCARDRIGKKPFYYVARHDGFYFASEPPPLLGLFGQVQADNTSLVAYLIGARSAADRSFFEGVQKLPPGHCMQVSSTDLGVRVWEYWRPTTESFSGTYEEACKELGRLMSDAVDLRLRSDVGFAVAASGGLDSTVVLANAVARSKERVRTVSVTFDQNFNWDETRFIEGLEKSYSIDPTYVKAKAELNLEDMLLDAQGVVSALAEPTPYTSVTYVNKLYEATSKAGIKVLLEGQGADELFGGYTYFLALQRFALARRLTSPRDYLLALRQRSRGARELYYRLNTFRPFLVESAQELATLPQSTKGVNEALIDAQRDTVLPSLLQYSDRLAMRWGVEVRLPFVDHVLMEFVNSLPDDFKVRGRETKRILRSTYQSKIPVDIVNRTKVGFGNPTTNVLRRNADRLAARFIENGVFANSPLFRNGWRKAIRGGFLRTLPNFERVMWRFMLLDEWLEQFNVRVAV
jgi:asparagine synthase (glutamine-hydrolysing)